MRTFLTCYFIVLFSAYGQAKAFPEGLTVEERTDYLIDAVDSLLEERLLRLDTSFVTFRLTKEVRRRIFNYVTDWPITTGRLLARSARYFPIFEEQLAAAGLPRALKYVTVQESALRPWANSHVGAGGLWQLMPGTARELGLVVNDIVDERLDAELGCTAALSYLQIQYARYGDWSLALAAYNCGPGNVNRALRRSRKQDYWSIRRYLPRETRNYLPHIIAAAYVMAFHHEHESLATPMELDRQLTEAMTIYRELSFYRIAQITGLRPEVIVELNPQYLRGYLPGWPGGHRLRLPARVMPGLRAYLARHPAAESEADFFPPWASPLLDQGELNTDRYYGQYRTSATVSDTSLRQVAERYGVGVDQLAVWSNRGEFDTLAVGDPLFFYRVEVFRPYDPRQREVPPPVVPLADQPPAPLRISRRLPEIAPTQPAPAPAPPARSGWLEKVRRWFD